MTTSIIDEATALASARRYLSAVAGLEGPRGVGALLLKRSRFWRSAPHPDELPRGPPRRCFSNAQKLLLSSPRGIYAYVEGVAFASSLLPSIVPIHHGWLVDASGAVVDPTWDDAPTSAYYGVKFERSFVLDLALRREAYASILFSDATGQEVEAGFVPRCYEDSEGEVAWLTDLDYPSSTTRSGTTS